MATRELSIGKLAARTGCKVATIRYYESIGLVDEPKRTEGGHRLYGEDAHKRLTFIRRGRELGFSLEAIRTLMELSTDERRSCADIDEVASALLLEVEGKIASLSVMRDALGDLLEECRQTTVVECRVVDALSSQS